MADVDLRRLVETAVPLQAGHAARSAAYTHPLGRNIKSRKQYAHPLGPIALPEKGAALEDLAAAASREIAPVSDDLQPNAWNGLLGTPGVVIPLRADEVTQLLAEEIAISESELPRLRRVALFSVLRPEPEFDSSGLVAQGRVAAMAKLSVLLADRKNVAERAWLDVSWASTTRAALRWLEQQMLGAWVSPTKTPSVPSSTTADLLIGADVVGSLPHDFRERVEACGKILGLTVTTTNLSTTDFGRARNRMAISGRHLLVVGRRDSQIDAIVTAFRDSGAAKQVTYLAEPFDSVLDDLREKLATISAVSASLQPHALVEPIPISPGRPVLPVQDPVQCKHWGTRVYVLDGSSQLWWTRDDAGHAAVPFKTYTTRNQTLVHEADRDPTGDVYTGKHKGTKGKTVPLVETFSCPHVESHLGRPLSSEYT